MSIFKNLILYILFFILPLFIWSIIEIFLPKTPPLFIPTNYHFQHFNIYLQKIFLTHIQPKEQISNLQTLNKYKLKAIYSKNNKGFVILEKNNKSYFVDLGKTTDGYKLIKAILEDIEFVPFLLKDKK